MKSSIIHVLSFTLMIILTIFTLFISLESTLTKKSILNNLNKINYYDLAFNNIKEEVSNFVINKEIKNKYLEYFTINMIKSDIKNIINGKSVNRYIDLYNIIDSYTNDISINKRYAKEINDIYTYNLFPTREYNMINKLYLNNKLFITISVITIIILISVILLILNKDKKFLKTSILSSSILLLCPYLVIKIFNIFDKFVYTNSYFSKFFITLIDNFTFKLFITGLIVIILLIINKLLNHDS